MSTQGIAQIVFYAVVLTALGYPRACTCLASTRPRSLPAAGLLRAIERRFLRLVGVHDHEGSEQTWKAYATTVLIFTAVFFAGLYVLLRVQGHLFLNPDGMKGVPSPLSLNTAASFVTNTNWQSYGGEATMSYLSQMAGWRCRTSSPRRPAWPCWSRRIRGFARRNAGTIGNFWVDLYRSVALHPAAALASCWRSCSSRRASSADLRRPTRPRHARGRAPDHRARARRPPRSRSSSSAPTAAASSTELGHPFENPNAAHELPRDARDPAHPGGAGVHVRPHGAAMRQAWAIFAAMFVLFVAASASRFRPSSTARRYCAVGRDRASTQQRGGNMEGKEVRFGIANCALWASPRPTPPTAP